MQYFSNQKNTFFVYPNISILNKKNVTTWKISCNQATLNHKKKLVLNGCVYINKILNNKCTQSIITNQAVINLINYNIATNNKTIIHGDCFYSVSSKMYFDFKKQIITLSDKIYTQYEIKKN